MWPAVLLLWQCVIVRTVRGTKCGDRWRVACSLRYAKELGVGSHAGPYGMMGR
jgi:hypothetical protein